MVSLTILQDIEEPMVANAADRKDGVSPHKSGTTEYGDIKAERDKLQVPVRHDYIYIQSSTCLLLIPQVSLSQFTCVYRRRGLWDRDISKFSFIIRQIEKCRVSQNSLQAEHFIQVNTCNIFQVNI